MSEAQLLALGIYQMLLWYDFGEPTPQSDWMLGYMADQQVRLWKDSDIGIEIYDSLLSERNA